MNNPEGPNIIKAVKFFGSICLGLLTAIAIIAGSVMLSRGDGGLNVELPEANSTVGAEN